MIEFRPKGPLLRAGEDPPGRWVDDPALGHRVWRGKTYWHTKHGPATAQWSLGSISFVWNVILPNGSRVDAISMNPASRLFRRLVADGYEYGEVEVNAEDATFTPKAVPALEVNEAVRGLFDALVSEEAFLTDIRQIDLAQALYSVLENATFTHSGKRYEFGQRSAGHFVAALRRNGEVYLDFAWSGNHEPADVARIREHFKRLGITLVGPS